MSKNKDIILEVTITISGVMGKASSSSSNFHINDLRDFNKFVEKLRNSTAMAVFTLAYSHNFQDEIRKQMATKS